MEYLAMKTNIINIIYRAENKDSAAREIIDLFVKEYAKDCERLKEDLVTYKDGRPDRNRKFDGMYY